MRLLFYRYGSICEPDYIAGFSSLGIEVDEITEEIYNKDVLPAQTVKLVSDELKNNIYDFVFSINFYPAISDTCEIFKIRYICHTVDSPVLELYSKQLANSVNRIFLFDRDQYRTFAPMNPSNIFHLPLATNPARWESVLEGASEEDKSKFRSDVSFVGSLYTEKNPYVGFKSEDDYISGYLTGIMNAQMRVYGYYFLDEVISDSDVEKFVKHVDNFYRPSEYIQISDKEIMLRHYVDAQISVMERYAVMQALGERYDVSLYTNSDPSGLPVSAKGTVKTLTEMPLVFNQSKINLNITTKGIREGLSLRIFDVLGCGGFLITNYQTELEEIFTPGVDLEVYGSIDELVDKVGYYLEHEDERIQIAINGHNKVSTLNNYQVRIGQMIEMAYR